MTDADIINLHKSLLEINEVSALRAIYNAGYAAGAGTTVTVANDPSVAQVKPVDTVVSSLKTVSSQKH